MLSMGRPLQALLAFALVVPFAPSIAGVAPHRGRTLDAAETSRLFGGGGPDRKCGPVTVCDPYNDCHRYDGEGESGSCEELTEYIPVPDAGAQACNLPDPHPAWECVEEANEDCSIGYYCEFDKQANVCFRSNRINQEATVGRAPSKCSQEPIDPPN